MKLHKFTAQLRGEITEKRCQNYKGVILGGKTM